MVVSRTRSWEGTGIFQDKVLAIIGVGVIGGSIGLAAKKKGLFARVRGATRRRESIEAALAAGAIDEGLLDAAKAAEGADVVVVATAVSAIPDLAVSCAAVAREGALITDVGSVKAKICAAVRSKMPAGRRFIGSHPMAGSEKSGVANARADMLSGATCIVTPVGDEDEAEVRALSEFWQALGMNVFKMTPEEHDWVVANVSHLPHVVAAALVGAIPDGALPFGASGLRDTTRVAAGDASIWKDIVEANSQQILAAIGRFEEGLDNLKGYILRGDYAGLENCLREAADRRKKRFDGGAP